MYFAEVRHFEEIFRQGQQPPGGEQGQSPPGGGNQQQAEQLGELQKQIINGTWKVIRRETGAKPTALFGPDVGTLKESQQTALSQLDKLREQLRDAESSSHATEAGEFMQQAIDELTKAEKPDLTALQPAIAAEQAAYQALLRLRVGNMKSCAQVNRSRRHRPAPRAARVARNNNSINWNSKIIRTAMRRNVSPKGARSGSTRNASGPESLAQLARRQNDVDERAKELQSALQEAKTEEERKELERQLKRLQEEQEEIFRDLDELQERMEREENFERMSSEREQLAQTRENVRQASEALEEGRTSQAIASGTRAQREMEDLQNELRKKTSNQFEDQMRNMRDDARELSKNQQDLVQQLDHLMQQESRSLRGSSERETTEQTLQQQNERLGSLLDEMKDTVEEAEESEPLLSKRLYDSFRQAMHDNVPQALEQASNWFEQGLPEQAQEPARQAQQGIDRLAQGVERAAESILGDESESLRRAQQELDQLTEQLAKEIDQADPQAPNDRDSASADAQGGKRVATQPAAPIKPTPTPKMGPTRCRPGIVPCPISKMVKTIRKAPRHRTIVTAHSLWARVNDNHLKVRPCRMETVRPRLRGHSLRARNLMGAANEWPFSTVAGTGIDADGRHLATTGLQQSCSE